MILLKDIFRQLASNEFNNIAVSKNGSGEIEEHEYPSLVENINLGILEIYKRFKLLSNEVVLHATPEVTRYLLRQEKVTSLSGISNNAYIEAPDHSEGCLNIIEITSVFDSDGNELRLNNRFYTPHIQQVADDILKITGLLAPTKFHVAYQAFPTEIIMEDDFDPDEIEVPIPKTALAALLYFVASRTFKGFGESASSDAADKSMSYEHKYELACQKFSLYGLDIQDDDSSDRFERDGWV